VRHHGRGLVQIGRLEDALAVVVAVRESWQRLQPDTTYLMQVLETEASAQLAVGDLSHAQSVLDQARVIREKSGARSASMDENTLTRIALLLAGDRAADAAALIPGSLTPIRESDSVSAAAAREWLVRSEVELATGAYEAARQDSERVRSLITSDRQHQFLLAEEARAALDAGKALRQLRQQKEAAPLLKRAADLDAQLYDQAVSLELADALVALADCLIDLGRVDEARAAESRARAIHAAHPRLGPQYARPLQALQARLHAV
jgi:tetratricopeptide (TPR) repeat protein